VDLEKSGVWRPSDAVQAIIAQWWPEVRAGENQGAFMDRMRNLQEELLLHYFPQMSHADKLRAKRTLMALRRGTYW
jgi:hypothetical protein